jgi:hypothetical protein
MRTTIVFILTIIVLLLTIWAWNINPSGLEYFSGQERNFTHDQVDRLRSLNNIESLRAEAINQLHRLDERTLQRDGATIKVQNLLTVNLGLAIVILIVLFYEIAARGKTYRQQNL